MQNTMTHFPYIFVLAIRRLLRVRRGALLVAAPPGVAPSELPPKGAGFVTSVGCTFEHMLC